MLRFATIQIIVTIATFATFTIPSTVLAKSSSHKSPSYSSHHKSSSHKSHHSHTTKPHIPKAPHFKSSHSSSSHKSIHRIPKNITAIHIRSKHMEAAKIKPMKFRSSHNGKPTKAVKGHMKGAHSTKSHSKSS